MKFINIGSGNMVAAARVVALAAPDSAPIKRLVSEAREESTVNRQISSLMLSRRQRCSCPCISHTVTVSPTAMRSERAI